MGSSMSALMISLLTTAVGFPIVHQTEKSAPHLQVSLDVPPEERWSAVVAPFAPAFLAGVKEIESQHGAGTIVALAERFLKSDGLMQDIFPGLKGEMESIANAIRVEDPTITAEFVAAISLVYDL